MSGLLSRYEELIAAGELQPDPDQRRAAERLDRLQKDLEAERPSGGLLSRLFGSKEAAPPQGVYMWGGVGRGKSMLMDLFVQTLGIPEKRRAHFHEFMLEADRRMKAARVVDPAEQPDKGRIWFGATVELADEEDARRTVTLVGDDEADAGAGRIGWNSPLARALRGAATGDLRTVQLPAGPKEWEIVAIAYP